MNTMLLMRRFTIRFRMVGAIAVVLGLLGLLGGAGMLGMFRIQAMSDHFVNHSFAEVEHLSELSSWLGQIRQHEKDMMIQFEKPDLVKEASAKWRDALKQAAKVASQFLEGEEDEDNPTIREMIKRMDAYRTAFEPVLAQLESSGYESATTAYKTSAKAHAEFAVIAEQLKKIQTTLRTEVDESVAEQHAVSDQTEWLFMLAVAVTVVAVVPLTLMNMQSICKPLEQARHVAQAIAQGDLSRPVPVEGHDEVADLLRALDGMQTSLGAMVGQVRIASESIATSSQEIASGNQDLSERTEQTASNVQHTVSAIAELMGHVQQTASSAQLANQLSVAASTSAHRGGTVASQAISSMQEISTSSRKISDIIGVIDSIAFQTNILALNAAVEAARAGEQGRGFAVVASEVRLLAQRSAKAANEIKALISHSVAAVDGGVNLVGEAGSAITDMVAGAKRVGDIIGEISAASAEQSTGIGAVNNSVTEIDQMTQQNAALVEQSAAAAESLREQAARLAQVVSQFRIASHLG